MGGQPSQKLFESRLAAAIGALDAGRPVVVEAESSCIGERFLPPALWGAMQAGRRIELDAPPEARARALLGAYGALADDRRQVVELLRRLPGRHGRRRLAEWVGWAEAGELQPLVEALVVEHYDPAYICNRRVNAREVLARLEFDTVGPETWNRAADEIAARLHGRGLRILTCDEAALR